MTTSFSFPQTLYKLGSLAAPICAGRLLHTVTNFIAMFMVAKTGKQALAASALAIPTAITFITLTSTIFFAVGIRIRFFQGQNALPTTIGILVKNGIFLALIIAIPAALLMSVMDNVLLFLGQEPSLVALTHNYFRFAGLGLIPLLLMTVIGQFYIGINKPIVALFIEIANLPLTLLASYALIFGHFGMPEMGLSGISLANLLVQSTLLILLLVATAWHSKLKPYLLFKKPFMPVWEVSRAILLLGLPIGVQFGGELGAMMTANYCMGYFGTNALAALQIANQYALIFIMLSFGLAQSLSLICSEDMIAKPLETFNQALHFLNIDCSTSILESAITDVSFSKLQHYEKQFGFKEKPAIEGFFFRKGIAGDWKNTLTNTHIEKIIQSHGEMMEQYGYL